MNLPRVYTCSPSWSPLPPPSPSQPSGSSQCTSPEHPVSCIEPGLAIRFTYDIIHVSMTFSQITPPSPSPTESKRLFYPSVSLLLSRIQGYRYHLSKFHIYVLIYIIYVHWCFSFWLTSLCIIGSSFIHLIRTDSNGEYTCYRYSFLDSFPTEAIIQYWVEFPVLYSGLLLVIHFMCSSVYMSIPVLQFIPSPSSPHNYKFIFSTCNCLFCR